MFSMDDSFTWLRILLGHRWRWTRPNGRHVPWLEANLRRRGTRLQAKVAMRRVHKQRVRDETVLIPASRRRQFYILNSEYSILICYALQRPRFPPPSRRKPLCPAAVSRDCPVNWGNMRSPYQVVANSVVTAFFPGFDSNILKCSLIIL